jgi:hypothetical protein
LSIVHRRSALVHRPEMPDCRGFAADYLWRIGTNLERNELREQAQHKPGRDALGAELT